MLGSIRVYTYDLAMDDDEVVLIRVAELRELDRRLRRLERLLLGHYLVSDRKVLDDEE